MAPPVRAFGLDLAPAFDLAGLTARAPAGDDRPPVALGLVARADLDRRWPDGAERLVDQYRADGHLLHRIESHPDAGFRLTALGWGSYVIDARAARVDCAPRSKLAPWRWQRYLIGQVLPFVATVHGMEVLHASAVSRGGAVSVFVGHSEAGKSSVAVALVLRGWQLVADDVVTIETGPVLHPGAGVLNVRMPTVDALGPTEVGALGTELGRDDEAIRLAVPIDVSPRAIDAIYLLDRHTDERSLTIEPLVPVDPRLLLSATFNLSLRTPERMIRQLDVCAELAASVPVYRIHIPSTTGPADVAAAIDGHG